MPRHIEAAPTSVANKSLRVTYACFTTADFQ